MLLYRKRALAASIALLLLTISCGRSQPVVDIGELTGNAKSDVLDLSLTVPDLGPKKSYKIAFKSAVAFEIKLLTPGRAYARLRISADGKNEETATLDEPSLQVPRPSVSTKYTVTVENRSTKAAYNIVGATLQIRSLESETPKPEAIVVPSKRRTLETYTCPTNVTSVPVVYFDADSTLRVSKSGSATANSDTDVQILPFVATKIAELNKAGYLVAIVSNQGGVSKGYVSFDTAQNALVYTASQIAKLGGRIDYIDFADDYDNFRKPNTGMADNLLHLLQEKCGIGIDHEKTYMVGDAGYKKDVDGPHPDGRPADDFSNSDRGFAETLQVPFHEPTDYFGWRAFEVYNIHSVAELVALIEKMEAQATALGDDPQAAVLKQEAQSLRSINGL